MLEITNPGRGGFLLVVLMLCLGVFLVGVGRAEGGLEPADKSVLPLKAVPHKIVYESLRKTASGENWELILINADGSKAVNLLRGR